MARRNTPMKRMYVVIAFLLVVIFIVLTWYKNGQAPVNMQSKEQKIFVVNPGEGVRSISNRLKADGLIKDPVVFFLMTKQLGLDSKIQAGDFRLSPSMNAATIAKNLTQGRLDIWVVIPEGKRAQEVADILQKNLPSYDDSWREKLVSKEGYLFPDTYLVPRGASVDDVLSMFANNFNKQYTSMQNNNTTYTQDQLVTVASLIEREAKFPQDRPLVASVIFNRLEMGMALQLDATVQYALGKQANGRV